jgi:hypothetical protein
VHCLVASPRASPDHQDARFSRLKPEPESEIFTKFADVKSRIQWTAERRQLLQEMWDRGDKAADIAAALGCKVGVINVARARFGLKPRRLICGRPKAPEEPTHKIERVTLVTSRCLCAFNLPLCCYPPQEQTHEKAEYRVDDPIASRMVTLANGAG